MIKKTESTLDHQPTGDPIASLLLTLYLDCVTQLMISMKVLFPLAKVDYTTLVRCMVMLKTMSRSSEQCLPPTHTRLTLSSLPTSPIKNSPMGLPKASLRESVRSCLLKSHSISHL